MTPVQFGAAFKIPMNHETVSRFANREYIGDGIAGFVDGNDVVVLSGPEVTDDHDATNYQVAEKVLYGLSGWASIKAKQDSELTTIKDREAEWQSNMAILRILDRDRSAAVGDPPSFERQRKDVQAKYQPRLEETQSLVDTAKAFVRKFFVRRAEGSNWL